MNVSGPNAPIAYKEQALRTVAESLVHNDQADFSLRFRASSTLAALDGPNFEEGERELFIKNELVDIKNELKKKMEIVPEQEDVEMALGGRKKRRGKKSKKNRSRNKKTRKIK
jgi:hypothetical protein